MRLFKITLSIREKQIFFSTALLEHCAELIKLTK